MKKQLTPLRILLLILLGAFLVRLYGFANPIADWHSWRQADTSAVSRNFVKTGYDLLHPRFDDLSNVPSGIDNPKGYRFVEFPLYNLLQAGLYQTIGIFTIEQWGRLVTIFSSVASVYLLYRLVRPYASEAAALLTSFFFAFLPFSIFYGRTILPDTTMVAATLAAIFFFQQYLSHKQKRLSFLLLSGFFAASALLLKPYALFFLLPIPVLAYLQHGFAVLKQFKYWIYALVVIIPLLAWRWWMTQYPEGVPANTWLMNGNGIRFRPAFFRWLGYERLIKLISCYAGIVFVLVGTYALFRQKQPLFFLSFIIGSLLYVTIFATGNVQHDYYQILILPTVAILMGLGSSYLLRVRQYLLGPLLVVLLTALTLYFGWQQIKDYYNINNPNIIVAGKAVDNQIPKDASVIAPYGGDTSFLYHTNRQGWASFQYDLPIMIEKLGADYLVLVNPNQDDERFAKEYEVVGRSDAYLLVNLNKPK